MASWTTRRKARKAHVCASCDRYAIRRGDLYLEHRLAPNDHDVGNTCWWLSRECGGCAERYGRSDLLDHATAVRG